ncbi:MAG: metal ABC transporter ATP-binding protein [Coprobacter sp.]|nr:metal ABC transporter ATP-binding protein [Coprobacter sp.]
MLLSDRDMAVKISGVSLRYDRLPVLSGIDLSVPENDFWVITGPNGGGKTSLLRIIAGLQPPTGGEVSFYRQGVPVPSLNIGYLPQKSHIDVRFPITVSEVVSSGLVRGDRWFSRLSDEERKQVGEMLDRLGLADLRERPVGQLSGGQLQRTLLGRAMISRPELLLLDEPSSYVDRVFESRLYELLQEMAGHTTVLLVSHDVDRVSGLATRLVRIDKTLEVLR